MKVQDRVGKRYGRLTVIELSHRKPPKKTYWKCICDCGNECIRENYSLNEKSSCGCRRKELYKEAKHTDLTGNVYGKLKVVSLNKKEGNKFYWNCICECGNECIVRGDYFFDKKNPKRHCGCDSNRHGESKTKFYRTFMHMKDRCNNPNYPKYKSYGARGIKIEWNSYEEFKKDMYDSFLKHVEEHGENNTTIERIDPNKNYCKSNCRWATMEEQHYNKCNTIYVILENNERIPLAIYAKENNLNYKTLLGRYEKSKYYGTNNIPIQCIIKDKDIV